MFRKSQAKVQSFIKVESENAFSTVYKIQEMLEHIAYYLMCLENKDVMTGNDLRDLMRLSAVNKKLHENVGIALKKHKSGIDHLIKAKAGLFLPNPDIKYHSNRQMQRLKWHYWPMVNERLADPYIADILLMQLTPIFLVPTLMPIIHVVLEFFNANDGTPLSRSMAHALLIGVSLSVLAGYLLKGTFEVVQYGQDTSELKLDNEKYTNKLMGHPQTLLHKIDSFYRWLLKHGDAEQITEVKKYINIELLTKALSEHASVNTANRVKKNVPSSR